MALRVQPALRTTQRFHDDRHGQLMEELRMTPLAIQEAYVHSCAHHLCNALRRTQQHGVQVAHAADALPARHAFADPLAREQLAQHAAAQADRMGIAVLPPTCSDANMVGTLAKIESKLFGSMTRDSTGTAICTVPCN